MKNFQTPTIQSQDSIFEKQQNKQTAPIYKCISITERFQTYNLVLSWDVNKSKVKDSKEEKKKNKRKKPGFGENFFFTNDWWLSTT